MGKIAKALERRENEKFCNVDGIMAAIKVTSGKFYRVWVRGGGPDVRVAVEKMMPRCTFSWGRALTLGEFTHDVFKVIPRYVFKDEANRVVKTIE
jgi:hypothetical protein